MCKHALLGHDELEQLAVERSLRLRKPSSETRLDVTAFLFSYPPPHCQEEKVMGHELWKSMVNTLPSWGSGQLQQKCARRPCGTWPAQARGRKNAPFSLCGALHSCSQKLRSEHCFLATEKVFSNATCSLTGENKMSEVIKDTGKHEELLFLRIFH